MVADGPASLAKVVMAELADLKLENKPWPGGKAQPTCEKRRQDGRDQEPLLPSL